MGVYEYQRARDNLDRDFINTFQGLYKNKAGALCNPDGELTIEGYFNYLEDYSKIIRRKS